VANKKCKKGGEHEVRKWDCDWSAAGVVYSGICSKCGELVKTKNALPWESKKELKELKPENIPRWLATQMSNK